jgi:hypothetical protein
MKNRFLISASALLAATTISSAWSKELSQLKVLYVGAERTPEFVAFLKYNVAQVESRPRRQFNPSDAVPFDVVLLDWPQGPETQEMAKLQSPIGPRAGWTKPTVLLGSAGLNLAVVWKLKGGTGCTCLDPLAYDLHSHPIFEQPFKIERKMVKIPTPPDFRDEIKTAEIEILPLVENYKRDWRAGWCSYSYDFAQNPDVEFFCSGVNHKTPTAAALWRQGNLLHFGFEQSPAEMNETGQKLLLNAIAYISRFTQDRPIAVTPSVFAGAVARSRASVVRALKNQEYPLEWLKEDFSPDLWKRIPSMERNQMLEWAQQNSPYLRPDATQKLEPDTDLQALGTPFDKPEFFEKAIAGLRAGGKDAERANRLLKRYVDDGPRDAGVDKWSAWWNENKPYLFASDAGDYRWYIDPLAKHRGVPTSQLRGIARADIPMLTVNQ